MASQRYHTLQQQQAIRPQAPHLIHVDVLESHFCENSFVLSEDK